MSILFEHITVLPMDGKRTVLKNAFVAVEGTKISYVGTEAPEGDFARRIDGTGKVLDNTVVQYPDGSKVPLKDAGKN